MKTQISNKITLSLGLMFVLGSAITQVNGGSSAIPQGEQLPVVTIYSTGNVFRGKTGSFVLDMKSPLMLGGTYVNFKISGTASPGVDYVALVSPTYIGQSGYGAISVPTLPDPRGSANNGAYSVVVTLEPGAGYTVGEPSSAIIWITATCPEPCW
jgi:hypothetical protein